MGRSLSKDRLQEIADNGNPITREEERSVKSDLADSLHRVFLLLTALFRGHAFDDEEDALTNLLDAHEVAKILNVSTQTVYRAARAGRLETVRVGRRVLFHPKALDRYRKIASVTTGHPNRPVNPM